MTIPSLRTVVTPADVDTREDRIEAMRILAAGNTIMMVVLGSVLVLQVRIGRFLSLPSCDGGFPRKLCPPILELSIPTSVTEPRIYF